MIDECVVAVYGNLDRARGSIDQLIARGTDSDQISLVTMSLRDKPAVVKELGLGDDALYDAAMTAGLGGVIGVLTGLGALVVSGLGVLFFVGPLYGAIIGGIAGYVLGARAGRERYQQIVSGWRKFRRNPAVEQLTDQAVGLLDAGRHAVAGSLKAGSRGLRVATGPADPATGPPRHVPARCRRGPASTASAGLLAK